MNLMSSLYLPSRQSLTKDIVWLLYGNCRRPSLKFCLSCGLNFEHRVLLLRRTFWLAFIDNSKMTRDEIHILQSWLSTYTIISSISSRRYKILRLEVSFETVQRPVTVRPEGVVLVMQGAAYCY